MGFLSCQEFLPGSHRECPPMENRENLYVGFSLSSKNLILSNHMFFIHLIVFQLFPLFKQNDAVAILQHGRIWTRNIKTKIIRTTCPVQQLPRKTNPSSMNIVLLRFVRQNLLCCPEFTSVLLLQSFNLSTKLHHVKETWKSTYRTLLIYTLPN